MYETIQHLVCEVGTLLVSARRRPPQHVLRAVRKDRRNKPRGENLRNPRTNQQHCSLRVSRARPLLRIDTAWISFHPAHKNTEHLLRDSSRAKPDAPVAVVVHQHVAASGDLSAHGLHLGVHRVDAGDVGEPH